MRRWLSSAILLALVACDGQEAPPPSGDPSSGSDAANDAMSDRDGDAASDADRNSPRCPVPVDCTQSSWCDLPPLAPATCTPITEAHTWSECSNGYVTILLLVEGTGQVSYYRDGKLEAVLRGRGSPLDCVMGPPDYVDPPCSATRVYDLCHLSDAGIDARPDAR